VSKQKEKKPVNVDKLIELEWEIIEDLKKMLKDPNLTAAERIRAGNALAYHASVLNKLYAQKGEESKFNDATLGEFIIGIEPRIAYRVRMDFKRWTKKLLLKR
jgi:hypothetical protein